ncbi:uncharacterized protein LOC121990949 [Zingiber officinale]|uniref:uncharacterized protein LOC121990949 n=1 Tax=Zingiber officinale TaxID=94328 RepID=UPI001C4D4F91|nr:uncharacterized protein LOC121990949 [Zingiber officinale]
MEEEEEQPFIALVKKLRLTEDVPFSDLFGTFVQAPLVPAPISFERGKTPMSPTHIISNHSLRMMRPALLIPSSSVIISASSASEMTVIPSVSPQPLALALPPLASGPRAKRTPCRRSSPIPGPSAIHASATGSTLLASPPSVPSGSSSIALVSTTSFPSIASSSVIPSLTTPLISLPSSSTRPSSPSTSVPPPLFRQAVGLPSQMGQASDPPSYGSIQLQGLLAESWLHSQEQLRSINLLNRVDNHSRQAIAFLASSLHIDQLLMAQDREKGQLKAQIETLKVASPLSHTDITQLHKKVASQDQQLEAMKKELQELQQSLKDKELDRRTLELQVDRLHSGLRLKIALKEKSLLDVSHKSLEQEQRKAQDVELSSLQKALEQLKLEKDTLKDQAAKIQAEF